jgi:phospholipid/cholesterol/gamma-HCH transport system ATP-binding protein
MSDKQANTILAIKNVSKSFNETIILEDVSFEIKENENLVILGKSGCGKSVLIKCIIGLLEFDSGEVEILGKNTKGMSKDEWNKLRGNIGFLFQNNALYDSMSVKENLEFPLRRSEHKITSDEINNRIHEALMDVQLEHTIDMMPNELSGGMKKRIALARTLIMKPKIIFYDEPTTGLDPITSREIIDLMNVIKVKYNTSSIIISHDMHCVKKTGDSIFLLWDGKCAAMGSFAELEQRKEKNIASFFLKD